MGKFDGKFIRGLVGSVVFREYRGKQIVQGVSNDVKQHDNSIAASDVFGKSSKFAKYLRMGLTDLFSNNYDGGMPSRFNGEVLYCLRSGLVTETQDFDLKPNAFNRLAGFEFNLKSPLKNHFFAQPVVSTEGSVLNIAIPEMQIPQDLKFPNGIMYCKMIVGTAMYDLDYGHFNIAEYQVIDYQYSHTPETIQPITLQFQIEPGCLCLTGISLRFYEKTFIGDTYINNKSFNPTALLHATLAEGNVDYERIKNWSRMDFKTT